MIRAVAILWITSIAAVIALSFRSPLWCSATRLTVGPAEVVHRQVGLRVNRGQLVAAWVKEIHDRDDWRPNAGEDPGVAAGTGEMRPRMLWHVAISVGPKLS